MTTWIIGAGGLLGSALQRHERNLFIAHSIPWSDPEAAIVTLTAELKRFAEAVQGAPWSIIWAAGQATTASSPTDTQAELANFMKFVNALTQSLPNEFGTFFLASSAGGVYAGSQNPPFNITTAPVALSPYGELKLAQEQVVRENLAGLCRVIIGRISNLYGPGQDLKKMQGLISRLALSAITKQPITMFVSLDTLRDYIYADDAAMVIQALIDEDIKHSKTVTSHIIASGQATSLGYLINVMQDVAHARIPIAYGVHVSSAAQARDLRLTPTNPALTNQFVATPLSAGVKNVYADILVRHQTATAGLQ